MGAGASTAGTADSDPTPSFASPNEPNATVTFTVTAADGANAVAAKIFVGKYEARVTPVADTDLATARAATATFVPGTYDFVAQAPGYGLFRFSRTVAANQTASLNVALPTNWASARKGATASGDGTSPGNLIDDTEATQWESTTAPVAGKQVTVALGGGAHLINRVQISALLQPGQNRFSALRKFELWTCTASVANANCATGFSRVLASADDAFPGVAPRPVAPNLIMRSFTLASPVTATHVRLVVDTSQCTGGPAYAGEQDSDPTNSTDCATQSSHASEVRAAELEVYGSPGTVGQPDLQVTQVTATQIAGKSYKVTATIANSGDSNAGASQTEFRADGNLLGLVATPAIAAGSSTQVSASWTASKGTHTLLVTADKQNQVTESNETNNTATKTVSIK